jgi:gliding motility-associated-like protein
MITIVKKNTYCFFFLAFLVATSTCAQISIGTPSLGFSQICADAAYNATAPFSVTFTFSPVSGITTANQFVIELSDPNGSFATPTTVVSSNPGAIITSPAVLKFSVPNNIAGEQYRIRIRSTSPAATSAVSIAFAAYYKIQDSPFTINNFAPTATYCAGGNYVLKIDNPGTGINDSPLKYPSLTYRWFKEPSVTPVATGSSLTVNQPGTYYVETNYGSCTSNSYSNRVTVTGVVGPSFTITSSLGNPFCSNGTPTTLTTQTGNSYQWFKDTVLISGASSNTYQTSQAGLYVVKVDFGGCVSTASITLQKTQFARAINVPSLSTINKGETKTILTTTDAGSPTYQWYLNNALITGATKATFDVLLAGDYKVVITQNTGCITSYEIPFTINYAIVDSNVVAIPNLISPNGDGINDTWDIPQEYISGTNTEVIVMNSLGEIVLKTGNYLNNWPENVLDFKNINPVYYYSISTKDGKVKKGSITVVK